MFEVALAEKFKAIFGLDKTTYDRPGESQEQEAAFIDVANVRTTIKDKRALGMVTGKLHVFAQSGKLPYGYFSKCIDAASAELKEGLFFYDFEENRGTFRNIAERSLGFVYLFDSQYDPAIGNITSINLSIAES